MKCNKEIGRPIKYKHTVTGYCIDTGPCFRQLEHKNYEERPLLSGEISSNVPQACDVT